MMTVTLPKCPQSVILPIMITLKERHLEVRELGSEAVITIVKLECCEFLYSLFHLRLRA
jgi:hypothetical protein